MTEKEFFNKYPKVALGFSAGVDSTYLLYSALKHQAEVTAYYLKTAFQPKWEEKEAISLGKRLNAKLVIIETDILADPKITANPPNRCYFCKKQLFGIISERAKQDGFSILMEGTNASDDINLRPGYQALQELHILSPLRQWGYTKEEIRKRSKEAGLKTWDKPSYACLATRIINEPITREKLNAVETAELFLKKEGFHNFRIRTNQNNALVQVEKGQYIIAQQRWNCIEKELSQIFYGRISLDKAVRQKEF